MTKSPGLSGRENKEQVKKDLPTDSSGLISGSAPAAAEIAGLEDAIADLVLILLTSDDEMKRTRVRLQLQAHRARFRALRRAKPC
jgi:hypothetical protein